MRAVVAACAVLMVAAMLMMGTPGVFVAVIAPLRGVGQGGNGVLMMNLGVPGNAQIWLRLPGEKRQQEDKAEDAALNHLSNMTNVQDSGNRTRGVQRAVEYCA